MLHDCKCDHQINHRSRHIRGGFLFTAMLKHEFYINTMKAVAKGSRFNINLNTRSFRLDGKYIIKDGAFCHKKDGTPSVFSSCATEMFADKTSEDIRSDIRILYDEYKYSRPSERSDRKYCTAFRAIPYEQLPDEALFNESRDTCQCALELYVLLLAMSNRIEWAEFCGNPDYHFYKDSIDGDLIILKQWLVAA